MELDVLKILRAILKTEKIDSKRYELSVSFSGYKSPTDNGLGIIGQSLNIGLGLPFGPLPANFATGVSNTFIIK